MPTGAAVTARRTLRATRRAARSVFRWLGLGQDLNTPHRPDFSAHRLASALGVEPADGDDGGSIPYAVARHARQKFGARFFVAPGQIKDLSAQLGRQRPVVVAGLWRRVRADVEQGLPIYAIRGARLGPDFAWASLGRGPGDDLIYTKRPHRFAFAPRHAWACLEQPAAAELLRGMFEAWVRYAATGRDTLCYGSNLAVIQRVLALSWAWVFLAGRPEEESADGLGLEWLVLQIIEADVRFLEPVLGQSAPNNHLLADRFAAWYLGLVFPEFLDGVIADAEQLWCEELLAQTYPDGGNFEHSSHYHEFSCEMSAAYLILAARNARVADHRVWDRTKALLAYQCVLTGTESTPVAIGNAIEDTLFPLDAGEAWCPGALREIYRALFDAELVPSPPADQSVVRAFWMLGGDLKPVARDTGGARLPSDFVQAGLHVAADDELDARLLFRTGPAPDGALAAGHMHADLLSVCLRVKEHPMIVDAGTYSYRGRAAAWGTQGPNWRRYFAGPAAHNGYTRDGEDPLGAPTGDFRRRETETRVTTSYASDGVLSLVDGRVQSPGGYNGLRRSCVHVRGEYWLILDTTPGGDEPAQAAWFGFQFAPDAEVEIADAAVRAHLPEGGCWIVHCDRLQLPRLLHGSLEPLGGWVSPRYGERLAAPQLRYLAPGVINGSAFLISVNQRHAKARFVITQARGDGAQLVHIHTAGLDDWFVFQPAGKAGWNLDESQLEFDGRLLWMRFDAEGPLSLRWLGGTALKWSGRGIDIRVRDRVPVDLAISADTTIAYQLDEFQWPTFGARR